MHLIQNQARKYVRSLPFRRAKSFSEMIPKGEPAAIDLLNSLLQFDPDARPDAVTALKHPWLEILHTNGVGSEPDCPRKFDRWREVEALETMEEYRSAIWDEVQQFRKYVRGMAGTPSRKSSIFESSEKDKGQVEKEVVESESTPDVKPVPLSGSEELVRAMEGLGIDGDTLGEHVGDVYGDVHSMHRLPTLPEAGQAENFNDDQQQPQQPQDSQFTRTRRDSALGGRLLRSLSTISVHEVTGGDSQQLYSKAAVGQYIIEKSAADAPISERPKEFVD